MEKKKMKIWQKILIFIGLLLFLYLIISLYKYSVLTKINSKRGEITKMSNYYYYADEDSNIVEHWQKDGIMKTNIRRKEEVGNMIMWENTNTGERFAFWNEPTKIYQEGGQVLSMHASAFLGFDNTFLNKICFNPLLIIYPKKYNNKNCYYITLSGITEIIDKETGLALYDNHNIRGNVSYQFDIVTDEDVKMPNLEEYTYLEKNS